MATEIYVEIEGKTVAVPDGTRAWDLLATPSPEILACALNGETRDLRQPLHQGGHLEYLTFADSPGQRVFRHSSAHLLAQAVKRLWPEAQLGTGPALEDGFYYDVRLPEPLQEQSLEALEQAMAAIVAEDLPIERLELTRNEAVDLFESRGEPFKVEIVRRIPEGAIISAYRQGEFVDLCAGPHLPSTGLIRAFRLTNTSGAYWRGDESNPMLTRIYGTSFPDEAQLALFFERQEEAKRRDHRKLGRDLDLVSFFEEAPGFPFWHPKGQTLYRTLENYSRDLQEPRGYQEVATPWIYRVGLWQKSGHWDHYRDNLFVIDREDELMGVKPMNCPGHAVLFGSTTRSYRDLPMRLSEYAPLSRYERSGTLHGLFRVRGFHQDDAHLFVTEDQISPEITGVLELVDIVYRAFGMPYEVVLSTRPDDYMGDIQLWNKAEAELENVLIAGQLKYQLNPKDGAFYGPKLDFYAVDALGRRWQCATVQLDFQTPVQFELTYVDRDGQPHRPVMIHRAIMGSLERFLGILIEHYAGAFPFWLAPEQVRVIPITDAQIGYAEEILSDLSQRKIRATVDASNQKLGYKVRVGQMAKIPVMLVVGGRDQENHGVSVRDRDLGDLGSRPWPDYAEELAEKAALPLS
jgi:threonyl-tRNA synthetase